MDGFVMHMFYNKFIYIYIYIIFFFFQLTPTLSFENFMYPTAVFFLLCIGFYKILIQ